MAKLTIELTVDLDKIDEPNCHWSRPGENSPGNIDCTMAAMTAIGVNIKLLTAMRDALAIGMPTYIGSPPAEIEPRIMQTRDAADALAEAANGLGTCVGQDGPGCSTKLPAFALGIKNMKAEFAKWNP